MVLIITRKRCLRRLCFYRCLSVHRGALPQCMLGDPPARETPWKPPGRPPCQGDPLPGRPPCQGDPLPGRPPARETPYQGDPLTGRPPARETPSARETPLPGRPLPPCQGDPFPPARETPLCQGDPCPGPHPWGKLRGIRSSPHLRGKSRGIRSRRTPKGEIQGDQIQANT